MRKSRCPLYLTDSALIEKCDLDNSGNLNIAFPDSAATVIRVDMYNMKELQ